MAREEQLRPIEEILMDEEAMEAIRLLQKKGYSVEQVGATLDHMNYVEPWFDAAAEREES